MAIRWIRKIGALQGPLAEMEVDLNGKLEWRPVARIARDPYTCLDGRTGFLVTYEPQLKDYETLEWEQNNPLPRIVPRVDNNLLNGG